MRRLLFLLCATFINVTVALARDVDRGYFYRNWKVEAHVAADNTWTINEHYDVTFTERRHGIYRYLQNEFGARRNLNPDGETPRLEYRKYRPTIEVISASGATVNVEDSDDNDCHVIRWGDPDTYVMGPCSYGLSYTYITPDDRIDVRDYIFHTLLPADVPTYTEEFDFLVTFDKELPADIASRLEVYYGSFGTTRHAQLERLDVTTTSISGTIRDIQPFEAVTLYAELPEGYYEDTHKTSPFPMTVCFYATLLLAALLIVRMLNDRGPSISRSVEFYAPDEMTPTLVGKVIDGSTDPIDIAALIPWLAQHGYLTIREIPKESGIFGKKGDIEVTKVRDLPADAPKYQQKVMDLLFYQDDTLLMSKIGDRHSRYESAKDAVDHIFTGERSLTETHHMFTFVLLIVASSLCVLYASPVSHFFEDQFLAAAIWFIAFLGAWMMRIGSAERDLFRTRAKRLKVFIGRALCYALVLLVLYTLCVEGCDLMLSQTQMIVLVIVCYVTCEMSGRTVINTRYRADMAGKLLGFREFISTAEKSRLEMLVDQDPEYFYKVLPYAMVFNLTDKWANLFKDIDMKPVTWYTGYSPLYTSNFTSSISHLSTQISKSIATSSVDHTKSSSSGGSYGGGFSGGGGGGGGAGSW